MDDSSVTPEMDVPADPKLPVARKRLNPDSVSQMISDYQDELTQLTENPDALEREDDINDAIDKLQPSVRTMEGKINNATRERREVYENYPLIVARNNEIVELLGRFRLLDQQSICDASESAGQRRGPGAYRHNPRQQG